MSARKEVRNRDDGGGENFAVQTRNSEVAMRIKEAIREAGGATAVKLRGGIAIGTLNNAQSGTNLPGTETLIKLAAATGRSIDWMLTGQEQSASLPPDDFVAVPLLPEAVSAGDGALAEMNDFAVDRLLMFRADWMRGLGINPLRAHVLRVRGDSMEPTLVEGDVVLADTGDTDIVGGGIFVIVQAGYAQVKRLTRRGDGSIMVISDNRDIYPAETVPAEGADNFRVVGRVRWYGRTLR